MAASETVSYIKGFDIFDSARLDSTELDKRNSVRFAEYKSCYKLLLYEEIQIPTTELRKETTP